MATKAIINTEMNDNFESLNINEKQRKYFNTSYKKVHSKLCDWRCDVQFRVGFANFRAHRDVLSDASDYFSAMFSHDMLERKQSLINIREIGPRGFECLLDYVYHGHLTVDHATVEDILETARFFHISWMVTVACDYLAEHLSVGTFLNIMQLVDIYYLEDLYPKLFKFFSSNLVLLSELEHFHDCVMFEFLRDFLDADIFMESSEGFLLKVIFDWLDWEADERSDYTGELLNKIRFGLLRVEELNNIPSYVLKYPNIRSKIDAAQSYIRCINTQCLQDDEIYCERGAKQTIITISACEFSNGTMVLYKDPKSNDSCFEEIRSAGLETELEFTAQATLGDFLFVAGGYESDYVSSDRLFRYDPRYRDWFELSPMIHGRVSFAMCSSDSQLFVMGGVNHTFQNERDNEILLKSAECYDPTQNSWSSLPDLPQGCYGLASAYTNNTIYTSGGITSEPDDPVPTNYVHSYILGSNEWTPIPSMLHCRNNHSLTAIDDHIYAVGGKTSVVIGELTDCLSIEGFDTITRQWTMVKSVPPNLGTIYPDIGVFGRSIAFLCGSINARVLYLFDTECNTIKEEQACGPGFAKVAVLPVAFPRQM